MGRVNSFQIPPKKVWCLPSPRPLRRGIYFCADSAECILGFLHCDTHSTAIHLCATGFVYTLQTFIKANLMGKEKRERGLKKPPSESAAAARGRCCPNRKTPKEKYLTIIYKRVTGSWGRSSPKIYSKFLCCIFWGGIWHNTSTSTVQGGFVCTSYQQCGEKDLALTAAKRFQGGGVMGPSRSYDTFFFFSKIYI